MEWFNDLHAILVVIQHSISFIGVLIILSGVIYALGQYVVLFVKSRTDQINAVRLSLGRVLILGLEFIVAADLIGTTTTPDYYSLGILGSIVLIRTVLSFSLNRELMDLNKEQMMIAQTSK